MYIISWHNSKAQWYGNEPQWVIASTQEPQLPDTRMDLLVRVDQHIMVMPNVSVHWRGPMDWAITKVVALPSPGLVSRQKFRRVFGRVFGRVN